MLVPRRVRRRLLLPPGWVALGFLLLLGCQVLRPWQRQLKRWNVMPLTMPALHIDKKASWSKIVYQSPTQLNSFRPWHEAEFKGKNLVDFFNAATTESAVRQIIADTNHAGGVRIRFLPGATYANLVKVLDIMLYTDQKKYWLDSHHQPITLYAITMRREVIRSSATPIYLGCCTCGPNLSEPIAEAAWQLRFQELWLKPWRPTALLLALIGILSLLPLLRLKPLGSNV